MLSPSISRPERVAKMVTQFSQDIPNIWQAEQSAGGQSAVSSFVISLGFFALRNFQPVSFCRRAFDRCETMP